MLRRRLGVSPREFVIGMVSGFVMSTYIHLMVATAVMHRTIFYRSTLSAIYLAGWALADLVWLVYALRVAESRVGRTGGDSACDRLDASGDRRTLHKLRTAANPTSTLFRQRHGV